MNKFYKPNTESKDKIIALKICKQIKATIADISSIPTGGINFLNGEKKISAKDFKPENGWLYHLIFGNQVNKQYIIKSKNIKSKILATAILIPIFTPYQRATLSH